MINDDGLWHIQESGVSLRWWTQWRDHEFARKRVRDIRNVGLSLSTDSMDPAVGMQAVLNDPNHRVIRWEETRNGDICEVTGHTNSGGRIQWVINAAKGWNVEQLTFELGDLKQEAVCVLREFDGVWFPETTDYFMNGELLETVQIRSASLNKPADRDRFTLSDMGAESGAPISVQPPSPRAGESLRWNGEDICSDEKWQKDLKEGKRQWGPMLRRMFVDGEPYSSPYETEEQVKQRELDRKQMITRRHMTRDRGLWEEYVRKFIARYQLDEAQSTQAKKILDMCQKRADEIISKKKVEFLNAINEIHAAKNANDAERVDRLEKRVAELRAPIEEIFERELKPRLDSLPTRAQRKAAEQADDSQPAKPP